MLCGAIWQYDMDGIETYLILRQHRKRSIALLNGAAQYQLNPLDPADAPGDADGEEPTNNEEYLCVPVSVIENVGPIEAVKRSARFQTPCKPPV